MADLIAWTERLRRDVLKCRKARRNHREMMMAREMTKCAEYRLDKASRTYFCKRTGRPEGCAGKTRCCPLKGDKNINCGKVR